METRNLICIGCPMGCPLVVTIDGENIIVSGNTCPHGAEYAKKEVTNPTRGCDFVRRNIGGGNRPRVC